MSLSLIPCAASAAPQLRHCIRDGESLECAARTACSLSAIPAAPQALHERAKTAANLGDGDGALSLLYLSSLPVNHALADGLHIGRFYEEL